MTYEELETMTYEELQAATKEQQSLVFAATLKIDALNKQYIDEHKPIDIKPNQRITVRMRITEESLKLSGNKQQPVGHVYIVRGAFYTWRISKRGEVIPVLWFGGISYLDELVSVEIDKDQPCGKCEKCLRYKDGKCFRNGGKDYPELGQEIIPGSFVCPYYEEIITEGLDDAFMPGTNYPNVTKVTNSHGKSVYRFYSQNYSCFIERDAKDVEKSIKRNVKANKDSKL